MPNFDKTGPKGKGEMTGRGVGPCNPNIPQCLVRGKGRGRGRGLGRGAPESPEKKEQ